MYLRLRWLPLFLLPLTLVGCEQFVEKSSNPLSPTVAGPMAGISIEVPGQISPGADSKVDDKDQPLALLIENPYTNTERTVVLGVQVSTEPSFENIAYSREGIGLGADGKTSIRIDKLQSGRRYYWRVKADDGANASGWSAVRSFDLLQPVVIGTPNPKSPVGGARVLSFSPILTVFNGQSSGPAGTIRYQYQVSETAAFTSNVVDGQHTEGGGGESSFATPALSGFDKIFFWRARILGDRHTGDWSRIESFRTPLVSTPAPGPTLPPAGSLSQCGPPTLFEPMSILNCHRSFYSAHMSREEHVAFLRGALADLNKAKTPGGPFGLLRKESGNNCNGYSCDVICAGQGNAQKQWDVLINEETPTWGGAGRTVADNIRVDVCEIQ
jgi:hypothetical protein